MVLQRWQSLLLFVAVILMACFNFSTMAVMPDSTELVPTDYVFIWVPAVAAVLLLFIDSFMYRNLRLQMKVAVVSIIVMIAVGVSAAVVVSRAAGAEYSWTGAPLFLLCALVLAIFARVFMGKDYRLLRSVDRLR